ncbi:competence type IV pilus minor pilin ComGF [Neobacillus sp. K501]
MLWKFPLNKKQKFVLIQNEQAFTLLEVLFAFLIFTTIIFFLTPVLQVLLNHSDSQERLQEMEWQVFCSQIKKEIRMSSNVEVLSGKLVLTNQNEKVYYEKYTQNLRRRVNSTGHEIALQNVSSVNFIRENHAVKIVVTDIWGNEYSTRIHSFIQWAAL